MAIMPRWSGTTTQRGLGHAHQANRKRQRAALIPGTPCWRCGQPMWPHQQLDLDHLTARCFGGAGGPAVLAHMHCNRSAGAALATPLRLARLAARTVRVTASRDW